MFWLAGEAKMSLSKVIKLAKTDGANITEFNLQIFNRWGQMVFSSKDILEGWDGKLNGEVCPEGEYVWVIFYEDNKKTKTSNKGLITLLR